MKPATDFARRVHVRGDANRTDPAWQIASPARIDRPQPCDRNRFLRWLSGRFA